MTPLWVVIAGFVLVVMVFMDRQAMRVASPVRQPIDRTVPELGVPFEDLAIPSGARTLAGWLITPAQAQPFEPLVLLAHGWGANYSTVLRLGALLVADGHEVMLFDARGHGRNPALPQVTIRDFRDDLMAVARYAAHRFPDRQLILVGHSFGGAAGVLAAADGAPIDGLVLIAAPADVLKVTAEYLTDHGQPGTFMINVLRPFLWRRVGGTFLPLTPSRRIRALDVPLLLLQPEHDQRVARAHADTLAAASGQSYHLIPGREHTDVLEAPETLRLVEDFLEEV